MNISACGVKNCMIYPSNNYECRYEELKELSTFPNSRKKLTYQQNRILQLAAAHSSITSSDLSKEFPYSRKPIEYGNAKRKLRELRDLKLLERDHQRIDDSIKDNSKRKMRYYYKLSKYGIYNLISNNRNLQFDFAKSLLLNYNDHILFNFFLFPYIKKETLSKPEIDSVIFSEIFSYLHDCCKQLEQLIFNINHTGNQINGYLTRQLFIWQNVPQIDSDTENLLNFLKQKLGWDWLDHAVIKKPDENHITVSYESNSMLITIDKRRRNATLSFRGTKQYEFVVRELTNDQFAVDVVCSEPLQVPYTKMFLISLVTSIPRFIMSLISHYNPSYLSPVMEILGQDEQFVQALQKTKRDFDMRYKLIVHRREPKRKAHTIDLFFSS